MSELEDNSIVMTTGLSSSLAFASLNLMLLIV